jgi:hypothetical protein
MRMKKRTIYGTFLLMFLFLEFACLPSEVVPHVQAFWPSEKFISHDWKQTHAYERYKYFRNLRSSQILDGLSKPQVAQLLGPPDSKAPDGKYFCYGVRDISDVYYSLDAVMVLYVIFDDKRNVLSYHIGSD